MSESIDGAAGGKVTARDRAASSASEGGSIAVLILYRRRSRRQGHGTWPRSELCERRGRHRRPYSLLSISLLIGFTKMGMKQASEQAFYQRIQNYRIIKMVK